MSHAQLQLEGLASFSAQNHMLPNEIKTKYMVYGNYRKTDITTLTLNGKEIERVDEYKSLGNILKTIKTNRGNIFKLTPEYLNKRARQAIFGLKKKLKSLGQLPSKHMFYIYESMVEPILLYGSDIWGAYCSCTKEIDKVFFWYIRMVLKVKATTCNIITIGESGMIPPRVKCHRNSILYFIRINSLPRGSIVKNVFNALQELNNSGFRNWYTAVCELASYYGIDIHSHQFNDSTKKKYQISFEVSFCKKLDE